MNQKIKFYLILAVSVILLTAGTIYIYPYTPMNSPRADDTHSTAQGIKELVEANNRFSMELYSELKKSIAGEDANMFYSPYSISSALAMVYEAAEGQTKEEISSVFHFPEKESLRNNFAAIYNDINKRNWYYTLSTGNALWLDKSFSMKKNYSDIIEEFYGGKAMTLDFRSDPERSRRTINDFIAAQTNDKINELIKQGMLTPATRIVLTNAIYFKGKWKYNFPKSKTRDEQFFVSTEKVVKVPMMNMDVKDKKLNFYNDLKVLVLELPYKGDKLSMLILLPTDRYGLSDLEDNLSLENLNRWRSEMRLTHLIKVKIPKFEFSTDYLLNSPLSKMGMSKSFSHSADFSSVSNEPSYLSFVVHQAYIKLDEKGTEAAAATGVGMVGTAAPMGFSFVADHPFIFLIQEKHSRNILFMGRIVDPAKKA